MNFVVTLSSVSVKSSGEGGLYPVVTLSMTSARPFGLHKVHPPLDLTASIHSQFPKGDLITRRSCLGIFLLPSQLESSLCVSLL